MTREEMLKQLDDLKFHCDEMADKEEEDNVWNKDVKALDMAIQALEREPSQKDIYLQGYSDAMKEHNLFIQNVKEYMDNYNYAKAMEDYRA